MNLRASIEQFKADGYFLAIVGDGLKVSPASTLTGQQLSYLKRHKAQIISELQAEQISHTNAEQIARAYRAAIDETDEAIINDVMSQCRDSAEARAYYTAQAGRVQTGMQGTDTRQQAGQQAGRDSAVCCQDCMHWQSFNSHGRGGGVCGAGVSGTGVCRWGGTEHRCSQYIALRKLKVLPKGGWGCGGYAPAAFQIWENFKKHFQISKIK
jgi:hypothetical protein